MDYNIWYSARWKNYINEEKYKSGLQVHFPPQMANDVREDCKKFCRFLRKEYIFPIKVHIYMKLCEKVKTPYTFNFADVEVGKSQAVKLKIALSQNTLQSENTVCIQIIRGLTYYFLYINHIKYNESDEKYYLENYEETVLSDYEIMKDEKGRYDWHLWSLYHWEKYLYLSDEEKREQGLRMKFDKKVQPELKVMCKELAKYLRSRYCFPLRVTVHIKKDYRILADDGDLVTGLFLYNENYDYSINPDILIATGDYEDLIKRWGHEDAMRNILETIAHELSHYYQWINQIHLTPIGLERQANHYAEYIIDDFVDYLSKKGIEGLFYETNEDERN